MDLAGRALGAARTALVESPFQSAAALRGGARAFHPRGVIATGDIELDTRWWALDPGTTTNVTARLSGGTGTPNGVPDVLGLAIKIPLESEGDEWDLLLASSGRTALSRLLPLPATGWGSAHYSSLMPYASGREEHRWILATPVGAHPGSTSLAALRQAITHSPLHFRLEHASMTGRRVPAGQLTLTRVQDLSDDAQPAFDPVLHQPPEQTLRPEWLAHLRAGAYRGSRRGRGSTR